MEIRILSQEGRIYIAVWYDYPAVPRVGDEIKVPETLLENLVITRVCWSAQRVEVYIAPRV